MRVIGRVLLGTLAILFAMVFLARLIRRRELSERKARPPVRLLDLKPGDGQHALRGRDDAALRPAASTQAVCRPTFLASQPGGSGWGRLVVPPSSPSRVLRRNGRRGRAVLAATRRPRRLRVQKTMGRMNYAIGQWAAGPQHATDEGSDLRRTRSRKRPRTG